jgi:preprotein translocase subunit Sec61beta
MLRSEKEEMEIILSRAGYVLTVCAVFAVVVVLILIFK